MPALSPGRAGQVKAKKARSGKAHGQFTNKKKIHHEGTKTRRVFESLLFVSWCLCVYLNQPEKFQFVFSDGT
jgi:hypothetical protein